MAFVVEDGTGLSTATSYIAVLDADAYFSDVGNATWAAALTADKQAALIRATRAVDQYGGTSFRGYKSSDTQALEWPRTDAYDDYDYALTLVPKAVKNATCEAALIELGTSGALTPTISGGSIVEERVEGAVTVRYAEGSTPQSTIYTSVTRALKPVMVGSSYGGQMGVLRT